MTRSTFRRDDAELSVFDSGVGLPVVFQHGLGGDNGQIVENFPDGPAYRRLTVECRAQGQSQPGSVRPFSIAMFAADILAVCDAHGIDRFVMGGISMGAAIALHIAHSHPDRVAGLVLARPAWLFDAAPENMRPYALVAEHLRRDPPEQAKAAFAASPLARELAVDAPDNLASLLKFFDRPEPSVTADLLGGIALDGPGVTEAEARALDLPTLVIGHEIDSVHPLAFAKRLAEIIPGARLAEITPKATDKPRHVTEFRSELESFLRTIKPLREKTA
ncbi:MAG: alpha/beta hydrolase [Candidatus Kaistia colombiensis]|nr:MAG: alpha/beta hydrolase [Kaistia sp.]